jgi:hypothetical protein
LLARLAAHLRLADDWQKVSINESGCRGRNDAADGRGLSHRMFDTSA